MTLSGKVVFITGAAQGLGKAYAEALLGLGAKVFLGDVNSDAGSATLKELKSRFSKENVRFVAFDVTDHQQFKDAFNMAVSTFGHVDVLVNNAGIMDESKWELQININFTSLVFGTHLAIEHMRKDKGGGGGRIINISSDAGIKDYYFIPVYCGTKHAVRSFTSSLALQPNVEELGIQFGVLCPDATSTDLIFKLDEQKVHFFEVAKKRIDAAAMPKLTFGNHADDIIIRVWRGLTVLLMMAAVEHEQSVSTVVDAFLELLQLEKMNGTILHVSANGNTYLRMEHHAA